MRKMKKVLALILSVLMCASLLVPAVSAEGFSDVTAEHRYYEAITYLASKGIINGFEDGTFKPEDQVTRAQFAKIMAYALGNADITTTEQIFTDVAVDHWAAGNIAAMVSRGIVNGMGDGTFAPESPVLYEQAVKMAVCALGYEQIAQNNGGYPGGYLKVATGKGFIKGIVDGTMGQPASRGLIAKLIDNMLGINQIDAVTGEVKKDSSIKSNENTETVKGQVVATYKYAFTSDLEDKCKKNEIIVETSAGKQIVLTTDNLSDSAKDNMGDYLGKYISATYSEETDDGTFVIVSITEVKNKNTEVTVNASDINDYDSTSVEYYDEDTSDFEEVSVASGAKIMYNGKYTTKTLSQVVTELMSGEGTITFLSSEGDGTYNVLFVKSYKTFIAGGSPTTLSSDDKLVMVYDRDDTSKKYELPKETNSRQTISYKLNGNAGTYSSIAKDSIVSIAESDDKTVYEVLVCTTKKTSAKVDSLAYDEKSITLDGTEYEFSEMFKNYIDNNSGVVSVGVKGDFYLDAFGKVAYVKISGGSYTYGYMSQVQKTSGGHDKEPVIMQIYAIGSGSKMTEATYAFKDSFYVNGTKYKADNDSDMNTVLQMLQDAGNAVLTDDSGKTYLRGTGNKVETIGHNGSQAVEFSVSGTTTSGYKAIDKLFIALPTDDVNKTDFINSSLVRNTTLTETAGEPAVMQSNCTVGSGSSRNLGGYTINSTTKVISVPEDKVNGDFYNRTWSWLSSGKKYTYQVFDATAANVAGLVIIYTTGTDTTASLSYTNTPYIVSKTDWTVTIGGEEKDAIKLVNGRDGKEDEYYKGDDTKVYTTKLVTKDSKQYYEEDSVISFTDLKVGDIVRFTTEEGSKELAEVEIVVKSDETLQALSRNISTSSPTQHITTSDNVTYRTYIGTAKTWDENMLVVAPTFVDSDGNLDTITNTTETWTVGDSVKYYVVDRSKTKAEERFSVSSKGAVVAYDSAPEQASNIFAYIHSTTVSFIVVFK